MKSNLLTTARQVMARKKCRIGHFLGLGDTQQERKILHAARGHLASGRIEFAQHLYNRGVIAYGQRCGLNQREVEGLLVSKDFMAIDIPQLAKQLAQLIVELKNQRGGHLALRIDGEPSSGKSILAIALGEALNKLEQRSLVLHLDSFLLLERYKNRSKGAAAFDRRNTVYDYQALIAKLHRFRAMPILIFEGHSCLQSHYEVEGTPVWGLNIAFRHEVSYQRKIRWFRDTMFHCLTFDAMANEWQRTEAERPKMDQLIETKADLVIDTGRIRVVNQQLEAAARQLNGAVAMRPLSDPLLEHLNRARERQHNCVGPKSFAQAVRIAKERNYQPFAAYLEQSGIS